MSCLHLGSLPCVKRKRISSFLLEETLGDLCNEIKLVQELDNAADEQVEEVWTGKNIEVPSVDCAMRRLHQ